MSQFPHAPVVSVVGLLISGTTLQAGVWKKGVEKKKDSLRWCGKVSEMIARNGRRLYLPQQLN
jgi:hypothetical protein